MPLGREKRFYKTFIISTTLAVVAVISFVFFFMFSRTRDLIQEDNLVRARTLLTSISLIRSWSASHGGVYVLPKKGGETSPSSGAEPEIVTGDGRVLYLKDHITMGREILGQPSQGILFSYRAFSLHPASPGAFEEKALRLFDKGLKESFEVYTEQGKAYFRYAVPVFAQQDCLLCHSGQGWKAGAMVGGGVVSFELGQMQRSLRSTALLIMVAAIVTTLFLMGFIYLFSRRLMRKTSEVMKEMERIAITDDLTGLFNRKQALAAFSDEFEKAKRMLGELSCIMVDIINFRDVNDRYGHLFGDELLRRVAHRLEESVRDGDIIGRYGGGEFLLLLPGADRDSAKSIAQQAKAEMKKESAKEIPLSVSICFTTLRDEDRYIDDMLRRIDESVRYGGSSGPDSEGDDHGECV